MITKKDKELMEKIRQNPDAYKKLKAKAQWERITIFAVLKDYGDPRNWG